MAEDNVDICVIGGGSGGLSVAAGAAQMGAKVALFEGAAMGGDCLNHGCVPSKALLAAAKTAATIRHASDFGLDASLHTVDRAAIRDRVKAVIAAIASHDSVPRFEGLGVRVIQAYGRFTDRTTVAGGGVEIKARRVVIATGSQPLVPPIAGLSDVDYLTNETIFDLDQTPRHLIILGGGPIGIEMAQAHRRLGSAVTVLEMATIMPKDDPVLVALLRSRLQAEGINLKEATTATAVHRTVDGAVTVRVESAGQVQEISGSHLLVAAGRRPNIDNLDLDTAGIAFDRGGISVDRGLKTSNRRVYAIGDVAGPYQFTHLAGYHAGIIIRNALFRLPARVKYAAFPWVTYTDPELAQVGLNATAAAERYPDARILEWSFDANDRAQTEGKTAGMVRVMTRGNGRILGASILGPSAGELIQPWTLALSKGLKIGAMATAIAAYPTLSDINRAVAGSFYTPRLFGPGTHRLVRWLAKFG
ncbi:MAG: FAD-dependent oxidoreductase [Rhodospirillaceae bacterium]